MSRYQKKIIFLLIAILLSLPSIAPSREFTKGESPEGEPPDGMVYIPAGEFTMGNDVTDDRKRLGGTLTIDETPKRKVYVKAFFMDKYEVTNRQYKEYLDAVKKMGIKAFSHYKDEGIPIPDRWSVESYPEGEDDYPVVDVDWYMANKYCAFLEKRLPTEEEWEKAARGTDERIYPWGDDHEPGYSNNLEYWFSKFKDLKELEKRQRELPVGSFKKDVSPYGAYDMAGNAFEWTVSLYRPYPGNDSKKNVFNLDLYVLRGGSYTMPVYSFGRTTSRHFRQPTDTRSAHADWHTRMDIGFRCVMDAK